MPTIQHFETIYSKYVSLAYLTDVLYQNFTNPNLEENNVDILIKDSILTSWSAFARSLLDCLLKEVKSKNPKNIDDLLAIDFFDDEIKAEYLATQRSLKSFFLVQEFRDSLHKYTLHLTTFDNPKIEEYRRKVFEYFDFINDLMNNFLIYLRRVEMFEPIMTKYPVFNLVFSLNIPNNKFKISGEIRGITLLSNVSLYDALVNMNFRK